VLIVDDTPENLDILTELLNTYRVFVALDGPTALELVRHHRFELILLDIMMPGMDGFEVCSRLKNEPLTQDIPVIFISAITDTPSLERAFSLGGVDYVIKPFRPTELLARVKTHLQLHTMRTRLEALVEEEITKRQQQERIAQRQSRLAAMGEMLDTVAHQWSQPLSIISLQNDLLSMQEAPVPDEELQAYCDAIRAQVKHMQDTLHDFRQFLRLDGNAATLSTRGLVANVEMLMQGILRNSRVELDTGTIAADAELTVNPSEFVHVLINLVGNAVDAFKARQNNETQWIRLAQYHTPESIVLEIEDNAGGIPETLLPYIFEADISGKPDGEGSGIGLYMSRRIVEKHGGGITAVNTPRGARFTITLPR
jgi:signal transduction histidine kinase